MMISIFRERKMQEIAATKATITGLALTADGKLDPLIKDYESFVRQMLPYLQDEVDPAKEDMKRALEEFVKHTAEIDLRPMLRNKVARARAAMSKAPMKINAQIESSAAERVMRPK